MTLSFYTLASGSSGNSYLIQSEEATILLDVGITGKRIIAGVSKFNKTMEQIDGIMLTHEHSDHVKNIRMISRKAVNAKVYGTKGTLDAIEDKVCKERCVCLEQTSSFSVKDINITTFGVSHDSSEPIGYSFEKEGTRITVITDTGVVLEEMEAIIADSDLLILEANHEVNILMMSERYPYSLKQRIRSDKGHLSNESAGLCISNMLQSRVKENQPMVYLAHLSKESNTPSHALLTVKNILEEEGFLVNRDLELNVLERDKEGPLIEL